MRDIMRDIASLWRVSARLSYLEQREEKLTARISGLEDKKAELGAYVEEARKELERFARTRVAMERLLPHVRKALVDLQQAKEAA